MTVGDFEAKNAQRWEELKDLPPVLMTLSCGSQDKRRGGDALRTLPLVDCFVAR